MASNRLHAVDVPANINHGDWTALLEIYVDQQGFIDYHAWREHPADRKRLDDYLTQYGQTDVPLAEAGSKDRHASLLNAYNAFTIQEVIHLNPKQSFWDHEPFDVKKYNMAGSQVSLNDIEHVGARPDIGYLARGIGLCRRQLSASAARGLHP